MNTYRVKFSCPSPKVPWKATTLERNIDAVLLTDLIDKALSADDIDQGVRILEIHYYDKLNHKWIDVKNENV